MQLGAHMHPTWPLLGAKLRQPGTKIGPKWDSQCFFSDSKGCPTLHWSLNRSWIFFKTDSGWLWASCWGHVGRNMGSYLFLFAGWLNKRSSCILGRSGGTEKSRKNMFSGKKHTFLCEPKLLKIGISRVPAHDGGLRMLASSSPRKNTQNEPGISPRRLHGADL